MPRLSAAKTVKKPKAGNPPARPGLRGKLKAWRGRRTRHERPADLPKLPNAFRLFIQACKVPARHWEVFGGILLIYTLINVVLISGLNSNQDFEAFKAGLTDTFTGQFGKLSTGLALFGFLITEGSGTPAGAVASTYQTVLLLLISLALIWALRQVYAGHKIRVRDAFYNGMHPLVQFILVMLYIGVVLVPAVIGGFLFTLLVGGGILQQTYEIVVVGAIFFASLVASVYMLCSAVFAPYIVTLPEMTPWQAIQSSKKLVRFRRANVLRKLLFLPVALVVVAAIIMVPLSLILTPVAPYVFFILTILAILIVHSYMYAVYRELIV